MDACTQGIGAAPRKTKQRSAKSLPTTYLGCSIAKSTLQVPPTFNKVEKTKHGKVDCVHLLSSPSSFFSDNHSSETIRCMRIIYIPNYCSTTGHLPFLVWGGVRATTKKQYPSMQDTLVRRLLWLLFTYSRCGTYSQDT